MEAGGQLVQGRGRQAVLGGKVTPAHAIPFEVLHIASVGSDLLLAAVCYGASQVVIVADKDNPEAYAAALREQMALAQSILNGLGYQGAHCAVFHVTDSKELERHLWSLQPAAGVSRPAAFNLSPEKRTTLDFEFDHLARESSKKIDEIKLPAGAPFGALLINKNTCTLCKACIGACPEAALLDAEDAPNLRFIERNCLQRDLSENTYPQDALT